MKWRVRVCMGVFDILGDRLEILYPHCERLKGLDDETWECLLTLALYTDMSVLDWAERAGEIGQRVLVRALAR